MEVVIAYLRDPRWQRYQQNRNHVNFFAYFVDCVKHAIDYYVAIEMI